jgi:predicted DNA-binding transcriptional regulator YafY
MNSPKAFQRLLDVALALTEAGKVGMTSSVLLERVGYPHGESGKRTMMRDLDDLRVVGLSIDNVANPGEDARYVLKAGDVRWRVEFTAEQYAALQAALAAADEGGQVTLARKPLPVDLDRVREAVRTHCVMRFRYNGKPREVDPQSWHWSAHELVVTCWERSSGKYKSFTVARIEDLQIGAPGSAQNPATVERPQLDPITWKIDPPVTAELECPGFQRDVIDFVGGYADGDRVRVTVTNQLLFLARVIELGSRARLLGPPELRKQLRDRLLVAR